MRNKAKIEVLGEQEVVQDVQPESTIEEQAVLAEEVPADEVTEDKDTAEPQEESESSEAAPEVVENDDDEVIVMLGEETVTPKAEEHDARAPEWVRELRKSHREAQKRIRELEQQVSAKSSTPPAGLPALGKKPALDDDDIDYDTDKFEKALTDWHEQKRKHDAHAEAQKNAEKKANDNWQNRVKFYGEKKSELKFDDFDEAESSLINKLNPTQQALIVKAARNPALVVYALGKTPNEMARLSEIDDPIEFALEIRELEEKRMTVKRKPVTPPPPEKKVASAGGTPKSGSIDNQLDRLRSEAEKTGDYSKVSAYRRQLREKERAR